jgi:hypothetical protein
MAQSAAEVVLSRHPMAKPGDKELHRSGTETIQQIANFLSTLI